MSLTRRGRLALGLALVAYAAAWAFGSTLLYPVAVGLLVTVALAWVAVQLSLQPMRLSRQTSDGDNLEGADVRVRVALELERRVPGASYRLVERTAGLGAIETPLARRAPRRHEARYVLERVPRGRYRFDDVRVVVEDPFGLERAEVPLSGTGALVVYPRLAEIERLFSDSGATVADGRRLLLRRPSGFDLHSVRDYERGDSLRKVHWRSTAKRGQLMVKELEDAPRDDVVVLLDARAETVAGNPPDSSFDAQVRAAGSILRTHTRRGRSAALVVNSGVEETVRVRSEGDWRAAFDLLAAAEATGSRGPEAALADEGGAVARSLELAIVTASLSGALVDRIVERASTRSAVTLVYVDAPSFAGRTEAGAAPRPELLRLAAAGVPVAVVRRGDDLVAALSGMPLPTAAHA